MTINKLIQNDSEVAQNEDINDIQDLLSRDINQLLEGQFDYNTEFTFGTAIPIPFCVIGGLDIGFTLGGSLAFSISPGVALVDRYESATWSSPHHLAGQLKHNSCQTAYNKEIYHGTIAANSHATNDRIDLIGVKFKKVGESGVEGYETRPVQVTVDNRRVIQNISVPKHVEYIVDSFQVVQGSLGLPDAARMKDMDADATWGVAQSYLNWMPLFAVRVPALTAGFAATPQVYDLRLFYHAKSAAGTLTGPISPLCINTFGKEEAGLYNEWLAIFKNGIADSGFEFPIVGSSKNSYVEASTTFFPISVNNAWYKYLMASGVSRAIDTYYYIYAFRPSIRSGYMSTLMTTVPPNNGYFIGTNRACNPSVAVIPPPPFASTPSLQTTVYYLTAAKLYDNTEDVPPRPSTEYQFRPFRRSGNYVMLTQERVNAAFASCGPGTKDGNCIALISKSIAANTWYLIGALTNPFFNGTTQGIVEVVPPHAAGMKVDIECSYINGSYSVQPYSEAGESDLAGTGHVFNLCSNFLVTSNAQLNRATIDIPFWTRWSGPGTQEPRFWISIVPVSSPVTAFIYIRVLGYYESF